MLDAPADAKFSVTNEFSELVLVKSYCAIDNTWLGKVLWSQEHADSKSVSALSLSLPRSKQLKD
jgi:hypothetical protein